MLWVVVTGVEDMRPALGESWKAQANLRIMMSCHGPTLRRARLAASSISPSGATAWFHAVAEGLVAAASHP